jgi:tetratricopeptide (TPR) repeat protein
MPVMNPDSDVVRIAGDKKRRRLRRQVNVPLLAVTVVLVSMLAGGGYLLYQHQQGQLTESLLNRAEALKSKEEWGKAAGYYQRYLWLNPDDFDARVALLDAVEQSVATPRDRWRLISMLYETIGLDPSKRIDLRLRLAENLLEWGDYAAAEKHASELLLPDAAIEDAASLASARRIIALSKAKSSPVIRRDVTIRDEQRTEIRNVAGLLLASHAELPGDVALASTAAEFYRRNAAIINDDENEANLQADQIMDSLVEASHEDPNAYVSRYRYRRAFGLPRLEDDLNEALRIDPMHYDALVFAAAAEEEEEEDVGKSQDYLERAIDSSPKDPRAYMALAQVKFDAGDTAEAVETLRRGESAIGEKNLLITEILAKLLIRLKRFPEAQTALDEIDDTFRDQAPLLPPDLRREYQWRLDFLHADFATATGNLRKAVESLRSALTILEQDDIGKTSRERVRAKSLLASLMGQLEYWDVAAAYWSELAAEDLSVEPGLNKGIACLRAATAYLYVRQPDKAIEHLRTYLNPPTAGGEAAWSPEPTAWLTMLQGILQQQAMLAPRERDWSGFDHAVEQATALNPDRSEVALAHVERLRLEGSEESLAEAHTRLIEAEDAFANDPRFWRAALQGYLAFNDPERAESALARFESLEPDMATRALLRAGFLARIGRAQEAEEALSKSVAQLKGQDYRDAQILRVNLFLSLRKVDEAKELIAELINESPENVELLCNGIETSFLSNDLATAEKWVLQLEGVNAPDQFISLYYRARLLLEKYDALSNQQRLSLNQLVERLQSLRPTWHGTALLAARIAFLNGDSQKAIEKYQQVVALGDRSPIVLERLVTLLSAEQRFAEASVYLARRTALGAPVSSGLEATEISIAIQQNELEQAIELAAKALERNPDDPTRHVWLASVLAVNDRVADAERTFATALERFPADTRVWHGLFMLRLGQKDFAKARQTIERFVTSMDQTRSENHFFAAQAYQHLGDVALAQQEAKTAVDLAPKNVPCRLLHAKLLLRTDVASAMEQFAEVLKLDRTNGEARRQLAILGAATGNEEDWLRAMAYLERSASSGQTLEDRLDDRLKAVLLARRGRNRTEREQNMAAARRILEDQIKRAGADAEDVDRLLLASICEQEAWLRHDLTLLQMARELHVQLSGNTTAAGQPAVGDYLSFLLRQLARPVDPEFDAEQSEQWEVMRSLFVDDAKRRLEEAEESAGKAPESVPATAWLQLMEWRAILHKITDDVDGALPRLAVFAETRLASLETQLGKAEAYRNIGRLYSYLEQRNEALGWYNRAMDADPQYFVLLVRELASQQRLSEAVTVCLSVRKAHEQLAARSASELAHLLSMFPDDAQTSQAVTPLIEQSLGNHGNDVDLLMSAAVLNVTLGKNDDAISLFRRVLAISPDHVLALNNLATLLGERGPGQREEAVRLVEQAMKIGGRAPALLDTLGAIQLSAGEYAKAVESMEEALAGGGSDARYYFHLASAYLKHNQREKAIVALARSHELGLGKSILTRSDQALLRELEAQLRPGQSDSDLGTRIEAPSAPRGRPRSAAHRPTTHRRFQGSPLIHAA